MIYVPRIKNRNFCPNPIAKYGIPDYANGKIHPETMNTRAHDQWWEEQIYFMINGYTTAGINIPGRFYKFLNFDIIATVGKGNHYAEYYDVQHDFFDLVEQAKSEKKGIIGLKGRRKGFSVMVNSIIDTGMRFKRGYQAGICAGLEEHVNDFYSKFMNQFFLKARELQMHLLNKGSTEKPTLAGFKVKTDTGWSEKGTKNTIYWGTMKINPNKFKGKYLDDQVFEEAGEFELLDKAFNASRDCWMDGDDMIGCPYVYGTGGNINKGSKAFQEMYFNPDTYNLLKFFVPATRMFFPCVANKLDPDGVLIEDIPYIKKEYKLHERYGMEDERRAKERILEERAKRRKNPNKELLYAHYQNNPLDEKESFLKFASNNFDIEALNNQVYEIESRKRQYGKFRLDWVRNQKGELVIPLEVKTVPNENGEWLILNNGFPRPKYKNLDVAGLDSYDLDQSLSSSSLGAMVVKRRKHGFKGICSDRPIGVLNYRPRRKETFYEECLKGAVFWNLIQNVMVDISSPLVVDFFKKFGCARYLAPRPKKFESPDSTQRHELGFKPTGGSYSKVQMIGLLQTWFVNHAEDCWFPVILNEALVYDEDQRESDWDTVDAFGMALIRESDMLNPIIDYEAEEKQDAYSLDEWTEDEHGNIIPKQQYNKNVQGITDPFLYLLETGQLGK